MLSLTIDCTFFMTTPRRYKGASAAAESRRKSAIERDTESIAVTKDMRAADGSPVAQKLRAERSRRYHGQISDLQLETPP